MTGKVYRMYDGIANYVQLNIIGIMCCHLLCGAKDRAFCFHSIFSSITPHNIQKNQSIMN